MCVLGVEGSGKKMRPTPLRIISGTALNRSPPYLRGTLIYISTTSIIDMYTHSWAYWRHVTQSTHIGGHTLDYVISREESDLLSDLKVLARCLSGHNGISCEVRMTRPVMAHRTALPGVSGTLTHKTLNSENAPLYLRHGAMCGLACIYGL